MCDYCDCRLIGPVAELSAEHEELLAAAAEIRAAGSGGPGSARAVAELGERLDRHAAKEERGILAELRRAGPFDGYVEVFERDHDDLHRLASLAADRPDRWWERAETLFDLLHDHILREESDLFPAARQILGPGAWDAVVAAHGGIPTTAGAGG